MSICASELRELVIRPTLTALGSWSEAAENLMLATAAQESECGYRLESRQHYGMYQIDADTHQSVWDQYLAKSPDLASQVRGMASQRSFLENPHLELATNLVYATAIAWLCYQRLEEQLPEAENLEAMACLWNRCFHPDNPMSSKQFIQAVSRHTDMHPPQGHLAA